MKAKQIAAALARGAGEGSEGDQGGTVELGRTLKGAWSHPSCALCDAGDRECCPNFRSKAAPTRALLLIDLV
jgi:hypothetical protein